MKRYTFEELKTLPPDHVFSKITKRMIHGGDGKNLLKHKVAWAEEWLKRRDDREPAATTINLPIYSAFNKLSNCQLKDWVENQKQQLKKLEITIQNRQLKMLEKDKVKLDNATGDFGQLVKLTYI